MAKKSFKKTTKQPAPEAEAKQSGTAYPAEPHELNGQRQRLRPSYEFDNLACFEAVTSLKALLQLFAAMKS